MHILFAIALWFVRWLDRSANRARARRTLGNANRPPMARNTPKPAWVRDEILRLKRLMPDAGCRGIEIIFNRRFALESGLTVAKPTWRGCSSRNATPSNNAGTVRSDSPRNFGRTTRAGDWI